MTIRIPDAHRVAVYRAVGEQIRQRRVAEGLTLRGLAERIGVAASTLSGTRTPRTCRRRVGLCITGTVRKER